MPNAITIDVEEYYHSDHVEHAVGPNGWHRLPSRVEYSALKALDLLAQTSTLGTFFVLGCVARRHPELVKRIVSAGHELASHGYAHRPVYTQSPAQFRRDIRKTKFLLEDISGKPIIGYRAPNFSIREDCFWAYDELIEAGYRYDSSLHPLNSKAYCLKPRPTTPTVIRRGSGKLEVFPVTVFRFRLLGREERLPVAGGAWWRLLPRWFTKYALKCAAAEPDSNLICYFHPWELDPDQPRFSRMTALGYYSHYYGLRNMERTAAAFLREFPFGRINSLLDTAILEQVA